MKKQSQAKGSQVSNLLKQPAPLKESPGSLAQHLSRLQGNRSLWGPLRSEDRD